MKIESIYKTFLQDPTSVTNSVEKRGLHIWKYLYFYNLYLQPLLHCVNNLQSVGVSLNSCHVTLWPSHLWLPSCAEEWCFFKQHLVTASILNRTCRIKCFLKKCHDLFIRQHRAGKEKLNSFLLINQTTQANIISISSMSAHNLRQLVVNLPLFDACVQTSGERLHVFHSRSHWSINLNEPGGTLAHVAKIRAAW